ncbi:MAG TPA: archease [bacterium]|nr:archease [bacterium]HOL35524.1 archease [bacterium]HPP08511.1 archease [bacterium]
MSQSSGKQKKFEYLEHPADIAIRVYGRNLEELFENAALGLYDILSPYGKTDGSEYQRNNTFYSDSKEELLVCFLNELLFIALREHLIFYKFLFNIDCSEKEKKLVCDMMGHKIEGVEREVKAVTYHRMKIRKVNNLLQTEVIFDI